VLNLYLLFVEKEFWYKKEFGKDLHGKNKRNVFDKTNLVYKSKVAYKKEF